LRKRVPRLTFVLSALAVMATVWPTLGELLVYDRGAVVGGDVWRLATAPLVHFSLSHLFWDLVVFGAMGWCIEGSGERRFGVLCIVTSLLTGLYVLSSVPELERYGGLSGPATAAVVYFGVRGLRSASGARWPWVGLVGMIAAKSVAESISGPLFVTLPSGSFTVLAEAHLIGAGCGMILAFCGSGRTSSTADPSRAGCTALKRARRPVLVELPERG